VFIDIPSTAASLATVSLKERFGFGVKPIVDCLLLVFLSTASLFNIGGTQSDDVEDADEEPNVTSLCFIRKCFTKPLVEPPVQDIKVPHFLQVAFCPF
jgi:hypothetical protein